MSKNDVRVLILTDHTHHSAENSLYHLAVKMKLHQTVGKVCVASRKNVVNQSFFNCVINASLFATSIDHDFAFSASANPLDKDLKPVEIADFDLIWLRLPPPLGESFLRFIADTFNGKVVINRPEGISLTGSKEFLLNFPEVSPPMKMCRNLVEIIDFKNQFDTVLKPLMAYGGNGLVKIMGDEVFREGIKESFGEFMDWYLDHQQEYLAVKYLKNVSRGDKRIIVVNGEVLGASLRLPPKDSWICNVAQGGTSNITTVTPEEYEIVEKIQPILREKGIVMYGIDTLVDDDGKRVLSELNTTSIGGLPQIAKMNNQPLVEKAIDLILEYFILEVS